jgi:arginyl-tRNA synthetase
MFAVCEQLGFVNKDNLTHIDYGYMSIKGQGKMSSRAGNVVYIDDLIDSSKEKVLEIMKKEGLNPDEVDNLAEKVAVGAVKYSILKVGRKTDTAFDFETALRLDGNSGPYLQYTHARACSVLAKAKQDSTDMADLSLKQLSLNSEEQALVRYLYRFPEIVHQAALEYEPSQVATYLYQLSQRFNRFYNKHQILNNDQDKTELRLALTKAVSRIISNGLNMLGIAAPERM